ncbi:glycosyltransferase [Sphingobacterium sp. DN00404]|uniref:Glycosyltransferase n=1 Tax=Sphingobacterium micropteri TaxID=2763501 RepID=A0ABR7YK94_9SPHI|nr:glycosyltransferase [Sphingobacterium micropteri]MBD1431747.1 glycosyltransferase [Sphingobacterium micropteri]
MLAPICLFTYNRPEETGQTIEALKRNFLAKESDLYIFSDGAKNVSAEEKVKAVRNYIKAIKGFKSVTIYESPTNKGLARSITEGATEILKQFGKVIVLEDDLISSPNMLNFMNQALDYYQNMPKIFSISAFGHHLNLPEGYGYDVYLRGRPYSWGWGTWSDRWDSVDWTIVDWESFKTDRNQIKAFNRLGSDLFKTLEDCMEGKNNSWAVRFAYSQFKQNKITVSPRYSKIVNCGFGKDATHCAATYNRHKVLFDNTGKKTFKFTDELELTPDISKQLAAYNSISSRLKSKVLNFLIEKGIIRNINNIKVITNEK